MATARSTNWHVVAAEGEIDLAVAPRLRSRLVEAVERNGPHLVVDLRATDLIDSAGLGVLAGMLRRTMTRGGALRVVTAPGPVRDVLRATGLHQVFGEYGAPEEATERESQAGRAGSPSPQD